MKFRNIISILFLIFALLGGGLYVYKSTAFKANKDEVDFEKKTIVIDGVEYFPRQDISTFLIMGIDKYGVVESSGSYRNGRNADFIMLLIFDETNKTYDVLCLNRDTMVEMPILGVTGAPAGTTTQQLALAHTYGSGLVDSCQNARDTVSKLLNNIYIDNFISMNMDGISIVTDALGGVEVEVVDDFSAVDDSLWYGTHLLTGEQAIKFVQVRKDVGDQLNSSRMERQKEFLNGIEKALKQKMETNHSLLKDIYEKLSDYMVSDCSINDFTSLVDKYKNYTCEDIVIPEGTYKKGKTYLEFYLDESKFQETLIDLLYAKKEFN